MSKHHYPRNHDTHLSSRYHRPLYYESPLEKLDKLTNKYRPKKVLENNKYKKLYQQGECNLIEIPSSLYQYYYIHRETPIDTLNDLIEYANEITHYTLDTEGQMQPPPQPSKPALIQIEFLAANCPSIIILIETMHLPPEDSQTLFARYNLFDNNDIDGILKVNMQNEFKKWFHQNHPSSVHLKLKPNELYALQFATYIVFNEWLNKRMTLANWGTGIDLTLNTITVPRKFLHEQKKIMEDEEEIRQLMSTYAINDCMSVTKLAHKIISNKSLTPPAVAYCEELHEDEPLINSKQNEHFQTNDVEMENEPSYYQENGVHASDEPTLSMHDDDWDGNFLLDIMKIHLPFNRTRVHGQDEPSDNMGNMVNTEQDLTINNQYQPKQLTRNQRKNQKKRINRYRFKVTRQLYRYFTTTHVKEILVDMNIHWENINIVNHRLFLGLKNKKIQQQVEDLLHDEMFTEKHYQRMYQRRHRRHRH